jgi:hypothetical protein
MAGFGAPITGRFCAPYDNAEHFWKKYILNQHVYQMMRETMPRVGE